MRSYFHTCDHNSDVYLPVPMSGSHKNVPAPASRMSDNLVREERWFPSSRVEHFLLRISIRYIHESGPKHKP